MRFRRRSLQLLRFTSFYTFITSFLEFAAISRIEPFYTEFAVLVFKVDCSAATPKKNNVHFTGSCQTVIAFLHQIGVVFSFSYFNFVVFEKVEQIFALVPEQVAGAEILAG